jgi:ABC-type amino acid transport substrate-binding protein
MSAPYPKPSAAVQELLQRRIDVFVHDVPSVVWHVASNEGELRLIPKRLNEESLAWAFRPADTALRAAADAALAQWEADGTLRQVIDQWLPYWSRVE